MIILNCDLYLNNKGNVMEQMEIIQEMLDKAKEHNLGMECLVSLINNVTPSFFTDEDLSNACENALLDWDI